jgi:hypothetical protein
MLNYIISLTTISSKFDNLHITIDSIINQTLLPSKIIINIPKIYNFRMNNSSIDLEKINAFRAKYSNYNIFINLINEDYGPGTKLLGLLNSDIISKVDRSNTYIILIDDDSIYKPYMIQLFNGCIKLNNEVEVCSHYVEDYCNVKIGQGVSGFCIKLNTLDHFQKYYNIIKDQDYVNYHDDFYISYYFHLLKKNIEYIESPYKCLVYTSHADTYIDALCNLNGKYARENLNKKSIEILNKLNNEGCFEFLIRPPGARSTPIPI